MSKYAIVNSNNIVENICIWDGVSEWSPCHSDDTVINIDDVNVQPGDTRNEDGTFFRSQVVEEVIE